MRSAFSLIFLGFTLTVGLSGCDRPDDPMLTILESTASQTRVNDLTRTMGYVLSERQYDQTEFNNNVSTGLGRWASYSSESFDETSWSADETLTETLKPFGDVPVIERIDGTSFVSSDASFLQAMGWLHFVAQRVARRSHLHQFELYRLMADDYQPEDDVDAPIDTVIAKLHPELDAEQAQQLSLALRLFDWVTRNIQLDPTPEYGDEDLDELRLVEADTLAASGIAAPGAKRGIWELLMYARGDYIEKAKLFMALCHQSELPAVMLATGDEQTPWAVGVLIGKEYYLFDTKLGLPIPGANGKSFATLSAVKSNPELLSGLDLTIKESLADDTKYWTTAADLKTLTGLVYSNPWSISRRIAVLESNLPDISELLYQPDSDDSEDVGEDQKLFLVQRADATIAKLPKMEGLVYEPWDIGFETVQFRHVLAEALPKSSSDDVLSEKLRWYFPEEGYIMAFPNYRTSRTRFLRGKFERPKDFQLSRKRDAIESFAILMYDDETIAGLGTDRNLQLMIGIKQDQASGAIDNEVASRQAQMRLVRRDSGLFMCQSHFDHGNVSTTANWVPKLLEEQDVERWEGALKYLNGRSMEARHQYDEALEQYRAEGPQQHGNLIRARLLKQEIETRYTKANAGSDKKDAS